MAHDVFISYSSMDKITADAVCATLESHGIRCWIAPRDVTPSMEYGECIINAIEQTRIMVLVFTANADASTAVRSEVERAVHHSVAILPFRVENVTPGKALEFFIGNVHWLDALTPPLEAHLKQLAGTVMMLLSRMPPQEGQPARPLAVADLAEATAEAERAKPAAREPAISPEPARGRRRIPVWAWGGAVFLVLAAIVAFAVRLAEHPHPAGTTAPAATGAARWIVRRSGTDQNLLAIFGTSDGKRLWAVGNNGTILESSDGGASWGSLRSGTANHIYLIFGTSDGKRLWVAGEGSTILESDNGGATWTPHNTAAENALNALIGASDGKHLWAVDAEGTIFGSVDGGLTWKLRNKSVAKDLKTKDLNTFFATSDGKTLWVVGGHGTIGESNDGGASWKELISGTTYDLKWISGTSDGKHLWAVGWSGTILASDDGGATWRGLNGGTKLFLGSVFGTSGGKVLWVVGDQGTILKSEDAGATWIATPTGVTENLYSIFGTSDGKHLWAVGNNGTILESDSGG